VAMWSMFTPSVAILYVLLTFWCLEPVNIDCINNWYCNGYDLYLINIHQSQNQIQYFWTYLDLWMKFVILLTALLALMYFNISQIKDPTISW